jgi:hypothetical protein
MEPAPANMACFSLGPSIYAILITDKQYNNLCQRATYPDGSLFSPPSEESEFFESLFLAPGDPPEVRPVSIDDKESKEDGKAQQPG